MEFDQEGRIILPGIMREEQQKENKSLILTKIQVSLSTPAVAQLKIEIGKDISVDRKAMLQEIAAFCEYYANANFRAVDTNVTLNESKSVCVEARSSLLMYQMLNQLAADLRDRYSRYTPVVKGGYDKKG